MAKFLMLGEYSSDAIKGIASERTKKAASLIEKYGGKIESMFALLGNYDLALLVDLPSNVEAIKVSIAMAQMTGITFRSYPAISIDEFDKEVG